MIFIHKDQLHYLSTIELDASKRGEGFKCLTARLCMDK